MVLPHSKLSLSVPFLLQGKHMAEHGFRKNVKKIILSILLLPQAAFGWSWIEQIDNQSRYNVRIKSDSNHGDNYVKIVSEKGAVLTMGKMYQNSFVLPPGAHTTKMDGFAIAPSVGNQHIFIMVDTIRSHVLQENSDSGTVVLDNTFSGPGGQYKLVIKNLDDATNQEMAYPISVQNANILIYLEPV